MDMHDQPTIPWHRGDSEHPTQKPGKTTMPLPTLEEDKTRRSNISRRKLFAGLAGAGVAVTAGGIALAELAQHGELKTIPVLNAVLPYAPVQSNLPMGHLLRRAGFSTTPAELATYQSLGYEGAVDRLINYQSVADDDMEKRLSALNLDLSNIQNQQRWWLLRMAWTQRPLLEKMTLFWSGVLTSSYTKVGGPRAYARMIAQNNFLRDHAFDTFDNIMLGITSDPAMLVYLDLTKSRKNMPNENYAREMMELFTLGLGHYTQQDVYESAAALTGWHVVGSTATSRYLPQDHNEQTKVYLGHTGNFDYKDIVNILVNHPATPWNISRRLFTFFAYENPSNNDLQPLVDAYVKSNHNMGAVMRALLLSPQFTSQKAYRSRVKSPTEFVIGAYRALGIESNGAYLPAQTSAMGQPLFNPPNVAGWPGDKVSSCWLNSGTWMARLNYINQLLLLQYPHTDQRAGKNLMPSPTPPDKGNSTQTLSSTSNSFALGSRSRSAALNGVDLQAIVDANHISSSEQFVDYFSAFLLDGNISRESKTSLVDYFKTPDTTKSAGLVTLTNGISYPLNRVRGTLYLILSSPEYQLN